MTRILRLFPLVLFLLYIPISCDRSGGSSALTDCITCPNNTRCYEGDCGCPSDWNDMGSWCLKKHDNLFVTACLDCPCFPMAGLYLLDIKPETGSGLDPKSLYSIVGRKFNTGTGEGSTSAKFSYFERPDGDSIAIYSIPIPDYFAVFNCSVNDSLVCDIDLFGKFHGPDTIEATIRWSRCHTKASEQSNFMENKAITFVRLN